MAELVEKKEQEFANLIQQSIEKEQFVKITLSKSRVSNLQNIYWRLILLKGKPMLSATFRYDTKDEVKNYPISEAISLILEELMPTQFMSAHLFTLQGDYNLKFNKKRRSSIIQQKASFKSLPPQSHDHQKTRLISHQTPFLKDLGITSQQGNLLGDGQKKFRQINKYIEIISHLLELNTPSTPFKVVDMGSGKGYLTFALYHYLMEVLHQNTQIAGIELRSGLVDLCNKIAQKHQYTGLKFFAQSIEKFETQSIDMLIALHACDIATDIAIAKGIQSNAKYIIVAPCCHKQIRKQINPQSTIQPLIKYGILEERQAELITDSIRALLLEAHGYETKVFEFIGSEHTGKNLMITAVKKAPNPTALEEVNQIKQLFGIEYHYLEKLLPNLN